MQDQINILQPQVLNANQMVSRASNAYQNLASFPTVLDVLKPDKFCEKNVRSWLQRISSYSAAQRVELTEQNKLRFVISYVSGEGLQCWEVLTLQHIFIDIYLNFKE